MVGFRHGRLGGGVVTIRIQYEIIHPDFEGISRRGLAEENRQGRRLALLWFLEKRMPKRFDGSMQNTLRWQRNTQDYEKLKQRWYPESAGKRHRLEGKAAEQAERGKVREPRTGGKLSKLVFEGMPEQYKSGFIAKRMRKELSQVANFEIAVMAKIIQKRMIKGVQRRLEREKVRKRV